MKKGIVLILLISLGLLAFAAVPGRASASQSRETLMICPSVSTSNANGMWVIGTHGAYYVLMPMNPSTGTPLVASVPATVEDLAQIPAGWALYKDMPSYPNFEGEAHILIEGIDVWLGGAAGFSEGDTVHVTINSDGTTTVHDANTGAVVTIVGTIPMASALFW